MGRGGIKVRVTKCKVAGVKLDGESRHDPVVRQLRLADRQLGIDLQ
jgi:hypothetical protein